MLPELDRSDRPPRILGIFAHPDDEVFCGGGLFAWARERGAAVRIVSLTRGEAGQIRDPTVARRHTLGEVRERELVRAAAALGIIDVEAYDRGDGTLSGQPDTELVAIAQREIEAFEPDLIVSFGPDGGYGHPDHIRISEVATTAGRVADVPVYHAAFPRQAQLLIDLLAEWLVGLDERFRGTPEFASGLMLFADGSSMLGMASDHMETVFYPPGVFIVEQGEPSHKLYLVLSGRASVLRDGDDGALDPIASIEAGAFFGETGVANHTTRNAHVVADTGVTCFVLAPAKPSLSAGRGTTSDTDAMREPDQAEDGQADYRLDVTKFAQAKLAALACHASQYALSVDLFPEEVIKTLFGTEHFNRAH